MQGEPVAGATLDLWQTDGDGLYEAQRPEIEGAWMRGLYRAQPDGSYLIRTVAPIAYTIPMDGTIGELMNRTNLSHMRPAHIHFALKAPGYHGLVTHLFQSGDKWIEHDAVYGVKEPLIVDFKKMPAGSKAPSGELMNEPFYVVHYDFVLEKRRRRPRRNFRSQFLDEPNVGMDRRVKPGGDGWRSAPARRDPISPDRRRPRRSPAGSRAAARRDRVPARTAS